MEIGLTNMAEPKKRKRAGRPAAVKPMKPFASIRGKPEFEAWFKKLGKFARHSNSSLIEHAVIEYAKNHGFPDPPPER